MLRKEEKKEYASITGSVSLRNDMKHVAENRHNPFIEDGKVDTDKFIDFLNSYNEFINHMPKPFKPIIERIIIL